MEKIKAWYRKRQFQKIKESIRPFMEWKLRTGRITLDDFEDWEKEVVK